MKQSYQETENLFEFYYNDFLYSASDITEAETFDEITEPKL